MKAVLSALAVAGVVLSTAAPAFAHEEIEPATITIAAPHFLTLTAANEETVDLNSVAVAAPDGVPFGETSHSPSGWTVDAGEDAITWTGGAVAPDTFESWGFEIEGVDQPGTVTFAVTLGFADGSTEDVDVNVEAVAVTGGPATTTSTTSAPPTTESSSAPSTTEGAASTTSPSAEAAESDDEDSNGLAIVGVAVGGLALILSIVALVAAGRSRRPAVGGTAASAGPGQDW